jgi:hypothetical protein
LFARRRSSVETAKTQSKFGARAASTWLGVCVYNPSGADSCKSEFSFLERQFNGAGCPSAYFSGDDLLSIGSTECVAVGF